MGGQACMFYGAAEFSRDCGGLFVPLGQPTIAHRFNSDFSGPIDLTSADYRKRKSSL